MNQPIEPAALLCCCVLFAGFAALCTFLLQRRARVQPSVAVRQEAEVVTVASQETVIEASSPATAVVPQETTTEVDVPREARIEAEAVAVASQETVIEANSPPAMAVVPQETTIEVDVPREPRIEAEVVTVASQETVIEANSPAATDVVPQETTTEVDIPREPRLAVDVAESKFETDLQRAKVYEIRLPKGAAWEPDRAINFLEHILGIIGARVVFRIVVEPGRVMWQMIDCFTFQEDTSLIVQAVQSIYPEAEVEVSDYKSPTVAEPSIRGTIPFILDEDFFCPTKSAMDIKKSDPLDSLVHSMAELQEGERFIYTLCFVGPVDRDMWKQAVKKTQVSDGIKVAHTVLVLLGGNTPVKPLPRTGRTRKGTYPPEQQKLYEHKLYDQSLFNIYLLLQKDVVDKESLERMQNPINVLCAQFAGDYNKFTPLDDERIGWWWIDTTEKEEFGSAMGAIGAWIDRTEHPWEPLWNEARSVLSIEEAAALWHLPHRGFATTGVVWAPTRRPAPAALARNKEGVLIGYNVFAGRKTPILLPDESRKTHMNIVGKTGVGKSTLMHNLIHQDIKDGKGVGVVDPHGKLISDILRYSIPDERIDDVVVIDIANEQYPPPLNPLVVPGKRNNVAAGQVVAVLKKVYEIRAQRAEDAMTAAMVTLGQEKTPTVRDVVKLLTDIEYRHRFLEGVEDLVALEFWDDFENQPPSVQRDLSRPVIHRMRHFYRNPALYPIMCHPDALDFTALIAGRKIILISLGVDEREVPASEQQLVGATLVSQLQMAAMASLGKTTPFFLFIDEVQKFVTTSLYEMLEEARKYELHLTVANQFLGQLKGKVLESIIGTVGATIVFQIGLNDAKLLAPYFQPEFSAEDLVNLDVYNAAVKARSKEGQTMPAFSLETPPRPGGSETDSAKEREQRIRQRSVEQYTPKTREEILAWLEKRYPRPGFGKRKKEDESGSEDWVVT